MIYTKRQTTYTSRAGGDACLSLIGAVQIIQDSICEYFDALKIDEITMKTKHNTIWVFTRNSVQFNASLSWNEDFVVHCAITERTPAKLVVDTSLDKLDGTNCVQSKTEICLVDLAQFKLKRIDGTFLTEDYKIDNPLFDMEFIRPTTQGDFSKVGETIVPSTSIDYCGHVNNVEYIRFLLNTYSAKDLMQGIKRFDINYISQSLEGDKLDIFKQSQKPHDFFEIRHDNKTLTKCRIEFGKVDDQ